MVARLETVARLHPSRSGRALVQRLRVGFLTDSLTDYYQLSLLRGALLGAQERSVDLVAFAGGVLDRSDPPDSLVSLRSVDALVVTANTMAYRIGLEGVAEYLRGLSPLPVCVIGAEIPGFAAVVTDNRTGMQQAVRHLLRVHGRREVAFIGGPPGNSEADQRLEAYRTELREAGIDPSDERVAYGDFMRHTGARAMAEILERGVRVDGVVAANDMMAFGARDVLQERGIDIPAAVAVVGFDDMEEGRFTKPPLTSVRKPLEQQGREALRVALGLADGSTAPETLVLGLELVQRLSCGCGDEASGLAERPSQLSGAFELAFQQRRPVLLAEMSRAGQAALGRLSPRWSERLVQSLLDDLRGVTESRFERSLLEEVGRSRQSDGRLGGWQRVLSVLRNEARHCLLADTARLAKLEDLLHRARQLVATEMQNQQAMRRMQIEHYIRSLRESAIALGAVRSLDEVLPALVEHLSRLGFRRAYLSLANDDGRTSRVVLAYDRDLELEEHARGVDFNTLDLLPEDLRPRDEAQAWVALPLAVGGQCYGLLLLDRGPGEGLVWETLREQVAHALDQSVLVDAARR